MRRFPDFQASGAVWTKYRGTDMKQTIGICKTCGGRCGHDLWSTDPAAEKMAERNVLYTVSCDYSVVAQNIKDGHHAQLMGMAPDLARMVSAIADSDPINHDTGWHDMGTPYCFYCEVEEDEFPAGTGKRYPHKRECLWRRCVELLAELEKKPRVWGSHDLTVGADEFAEDEENSKARLRD